MSEGGRRKKQDTCLPPYDIDNNNNREQTIEKKKNNSVCVYQEDSFHGLYFSAGINKDFFHVYSGGTPIQEVNARMAKLIFNTWMWVCVTALQFFAIERGIIKQGPPQKLCSWKRISTMWIGFVSSRRHTKWGNSWSPTKKRSWKIVYLIVELVSCNFLELLGFLWTDELRSLWFSDPARRPTTAVDERPWNRSRLAFLSRPGLAHRYAFSTGQVCVLVQHVTSYVYVCVCVFLSNDRYTHTHDDGGFSSLLLKSNRQTYTHNV